MNESDPFAAGRKLLALWTEAGLGATQAAAELLRAGADALAGGDPAHVSRLWTDLWTDLFADAPPELTGAWEGKAFGADVFGADGLPDLAGPPPDAEALQAAWSKSWGEYEGELSGLPEDAFAVDFKPLAAAWGAVVSGHADDTQRGMVSRFVSAMAVKARYGAEYYADPTRTAVAPTPRTRAYGTGGIDLFRYDRDTAADGEPVLIVYSVINRSYILDLTEDCSFIAHLLRRGLDVWLIEWNGAEAGDSETLEDYVLGIGACVDHVRDATGAPRVALFGHCIGGTLAAMHAALRPDTVSRFLALTAPFKTPAEGVVASAVDPAIFDVDEVVRTHRRMPAKLIRYTFMGLKPWHELLKWKMFLGGLADPAAAARFAVIDRWANDNVDIPAEVFRQYIDEVFHSGRLVAGETVIGGRTVDLSAIDCPVLNAAGEGDWIVPRDSARPLTDAVGAEDNRWVELPGGHLSLLLDPRQRGRWDELADFLRGDA